MANLVCSPAAAVAFDFFIRKGLRDFQAAAIVGNLQWESRINPQLVAMDTNGLPSRGIAMWQPPRWNNLLEFASGNDATALNTQLEFLWHELQMMPSLGLGALLATTTVEDATVVFQNQFERPKQSLAHTSDRIAHARSALYACPNVKPPATQKRVGAIVAVFAIVAATGYGVYKIVTAHPEPLLPPPPPDRIPPWARPEPEPVFYRRRIP